MKVTSPKTESKQKMMTMDVCGTDEAMASVYLDNKLVKQTDWKPISQQCWDVKFTLDLDRVCFPPVLFSQVAWSQGHCPITCRCWRACTSLCV